MEGQHKIFKYEQEFDIRTYDADFTRMAAPVSLLGYMQEMATVHAEKLGLGYEDSKEHGFYWVIGRSKYKFHTMPRLFEHITVRTWPAGVDGLCALRRFEFFVNGVSIGYGLTYWLMLDTQSYRPIKPAYFSEMTKDLPIQEEDFFQLKKEAMPKNMTWIYRRTMCNSDLDWNNHVNNLKYAELVYNAIPLEQLKQHNLAELQINYLKEIQINDEVSVYMANEGNKYYIEGKVDDKSMFNAVGILE